MSPLLVSLPWGERFALPLHCHPAHPAEIWHIQHLPAQAWTGTSQSSLHTHLRHIAHTVWNDPQLVSCDVFLIIRPAWTTRLALTHSSYCLWSHTLFNIVSQGCLDWFLVSPSPSRIWCCVYNTLRSSCWGAGALAPFVRSLPYQHEVLCSYSQSPIIKQS